MSNRSASSAGCSSLQRAYALAGEADNLAAAVDHDAAAARYAEAVERAPDAAELRFWAALARAAGGTSTERLPPWATSPQPEAH